MFYHIEYQQHHSYHIHGLLWIGDAPKYVKQNEDIYEYNDKIISCRTDVYEELQHLLLQKHKHSKTCMKIPNG